MLPVVVIPMSPLRFPFSFYDSCCILILAASLSMYTVFLISSAMSAVTSYFSSAASAALRDSVPWSLLEGFLTGIWYIAVFVVLIALLLLALTVALLHCTVYHFFVIGPFATNTTKLGIPGLGQNDIAADSRRDPEAGILAGLRISLLPDYSRWAAVTIWCSVCLPAAAAVTFVLEAVDTAGQEDEFRGTEVLWCYESSWSSTVPGYRAWNCHIKGFHRSFPD